MISDRNERLLIKKIICPGMIIIDVGANVGVYTKFFSRLVGSNGLVYAFEPSPDNFSRLVSRLRSFSNVKLNEKAVGENNTKLKLFISDNVNVDHRMFDSKDGRRKIDVDVVSLDDYFVDSYKVDLIKIDVQGYELSVLKGARKLIKKNRNIKIIMEFWPYGLHKAGVNPKDLLDFLRSFNLKILEIGRVELSPFEYNENIVDVDFYCNLFISKNM